MKPRKEKQEGGEEGRSMKKEAKKRDNKGVKKEGQGRRGAKLICRQETHKKSTRRIKE